MNIFQPVLWITLGGLVIAYCVIRFVLLPWLAPRLFAMLGKKMRGGGYDSARAKGASHSEAVTQGRQAEREHDDRALAKQSGVPLEIIRGFRRGHPNMVLGAEELAADDVGARVRVYGAEAEIDGYAGNFAEALFRLDGTRIADDVDEVAGNATLVESLTWEALPENIRRAATAAVPEGDFLEAYAPDEQDPYYEVTLTGPFDQWTVEIDVGGKVLRKMKQRAGNRTL